MKLSLPSSLVKNSISSHSWLGLLTGALMYLICVSGTIVVFTKYLERWEQPDVAEFQFMSAETAGLVYNQLHEIAPDVGGDILLMLPRPDEPRASLFSSEGGWYLNEDGSRGDDLSHQWTTMLADLHVYLHLPSSFGMVVVSILGAMLCGLIISGLFSHPNIIRDAFSLRWGSSRRLQQTDLHNRLSVWGAPFHLVIAVTGAYFGIAVLMNMLFASALFEGNAGRVVDEVYGAAPALQQEVAVMDLEAALNELAIVAPDAKPFYVTIEEANTPQQYMIIGAEHEGRLIYAEQYRFDHAGQYLGKAGYTDGSVGRQAIFSVFRLHFGEFGGLPILFLYGVFGLALSVVCVSGINIWLARRKTRDALNNLWIGLVWGTPIAIAGSALLVVLTGLAATTTLWLVLVACIALSQAVNNDLRSTSLLQLLAGILLLMLVLVHTLIYQHMALRGAALIVNLFLASGGAIMLWLGLHSGIFSRVITPPA